MFLMTLASVFYPMRELLPIFERQSQLLCDSAELLCEMQQSLDRDHWKTVYSEIRNNEHMGDAQLT